MAFSRSVTTFALVAATNFDASAASDVPAALRGAARPDALQGHTKNDDYFHLLKLLIINSFASRYGATDPYGATDIIDTDATAPSGLTPQQCEERCTADSSCMCVRQERSTGKCWKRSSCEPSKWTSEYNAGYNVYMKRDSAPPTPAPSPQWSKLELFSNPKKCLDVKDHQTYNGSMVQLWDCIDSDNDQYWNTGSRDADINGDLKWASHPEKCLDVKDHQTANGTPVQIWDCIASDFDQQFYLDFSVAPGGSASIPRPVGLLRWKDHPSKCVVAKNGGDWNGNGIVLEECDESEERQYWVNDYVVR